MIKSAVKEFIFSKNPKAPSCHASTVLPLDNGDVLVAWFGGAREGDKSVEIWVSRRDKNNNWSKPISISEGDNIPHWNPVLYKRENGEIILYYKHGEKISDWITKYIISYDNGNTWSHPQILVPGDTSGGRGPVKNKCLKLKDGTLLAPASTEQNKKWIPFIDVSKDDGLTWNASPKMERPKYKGVYVGLIQPALWESDNGAIHCFLRSDKGAIYRSDSTDNGLTWKKPYRTRLPNNNSGIDAVNDNSGRLWLIYNPVDVNWGVRHPLSLAYSKDNGKHFTEVLIPEPGFGEFSYPAITCKDNTLYITYTYKRKQIVFWKIELED